MEDHIGKTDCLTNDKLCELIDNRELLGVGVKERLYLPIGLAPRLNEVDILGDKTEKCPKTDNADHSRRGVKRVLKHLHTVKEYGEEHCGDGKQCRDKHGHGGDKDEHKKKPRVIIGIIALCHAVCDKHRHHEHKALTYLVNVIGNELREEYERGCCGEGEKNGVVLREVQGLHKTRGVGDHRQKKHYCKDDRYYRNGNISYEREKTKKLYVLEDKVKHCGYSREFDYEPDYLEDKLPQGTKIAHVHLLLKLHLDERYKCSPGLKEAIQEATLVFYLRHTFTP